MYLRASKFHAKAQRKNDKLCVFAPLIFLRENFR